VHLLARAVGVEPEGVVLLAVQDAGARAHPLGEPGVEDAAVAGGVLVHERALHHPGHDLHVAVGVGLEAVPAWTRSSLLTTSRPWWVLPAS
jgi:hypothetical protein